MRGKIFKIFIKAVGVLFLSAVLFSSTALLLVEASDDEFQLLIEENKALRNEIIRLKIQAWGSATKIPVLMYHHILSEKEIKDHGWVGNSSVIAAEDFKNQMEYLYNNNFHTVTLSELEEFLNKGKALPKKTVLITFDDGYLSNIKYAYPIMKDYGFKGTIFMIGKYSEAEPMEFDPAGLQFISNHIKQKYTDVFEYGCHTFAMHALDHNKPYLISKPIPEVKNDLMRNQEIYKTNAIAYPYGAYNHNIIETLHELEYILGFTIKTGYIDKSSKNLELPRFGIYPSTGIHKFINIVEGKMNTSH